MIYKKNSTRSAITTFCVLTTDTNFSADPVRPKRADYTKVLAQQCARKLHSNACHGIIINKSQTSGESKHTRTQHAQHTHTHTLTRTQPENKELVFVAGFCGCARACVHLFELFAANENARCYRCSFILHAISWNTRGGGGGSGCWVRVRSFANRQINLHRKQLIVASACVRMCVCRYVMVCSGFVDIMGADAHH